MEGHVDAREGDRRFAAFEGGDVLWDGGKREGGDVEWGGVRGGEDGVEDLLEKRQGAQVTGADVLAVADVVVDDFEEERG